MRQNIADMHVLAVKVKRNCGMRWIVDLPLCDSQSVGKNMSLLCFTLSSNKVYVK